MVENMKGAHVSREAEGGTLSRAVAASPGLPPTQPWLQEHKHQVPPGYFWLEVPQNPPGWIFSAFIHPATALSLR